MPFTGKFGALNDIRICQLGCQGIVCVNTFAGYHLKPNSSCLWTSDLVLLNEILIIFSSHSQTVHVTKATAWSLHPQRVVWMGVGEIYGSTSYYFPEVLLSYLTCWYLKEIWFLWHLTTRRWFRTQLVVSQELPSSGVHPNKGLLLSQHPVMTCLLRWNPQQVGGLHHTMWNKLICLTRMRKWAEKNFAGFYQRQNPFLCLGCDKRGGTEGVVSIRTSLHGCFDNTDASVGGRELDTDFPVLSGHQWPLKHHTK